MDYSNGETIMKNTTIIATAAAASKTITNWEAMVAFRRKMKEEAPETFRELMEERRRDDLPAPTVRGYWQ